VVCGCDTARGARVRVIYVHAAVLRWRAEGSAWPLAATARSESPIVSLSVQLHELFGGIRCPRAGGEECHLRATLGDPVGSRDRPCVWPTVARRPPRARRDPQRYEKGSAGIFRRGVGRRQI